MKLTLEHLAPYLPYGLNIYDGEYSRELSIYSTTYNTDQVGISRLFIPNYDHSLGLPILRPLSDLTKEIDHNGERFVPYQVLEAKFNIEDLNTDLEYLVKREDDGNVFISLVNQNNILKKLYNWHFDLHGLIEQGLAINMNDL